MAPFTITCTTCKSRLKVKSAAAVGQVVPCPKCGGMVMIKPPEEPLPAEVGNAATKPVEERAESASPHNTKDFDDVELILAGAAPLPVAAPPARAEAPPAPKLETSPGAKDGQAASQASPMPQAAPIDGRAEAAPPGPRIGSYGTWLAISILAGIMLAVGVVVVSSVLLRDLGRSGPSHPPIAKSRSALRAEGEHADQPASDPAAAKDDASANDAAPTEEEAPATPPVTAVANQEPKTPRADRTESKSSDPLDIAGPAPAPAASQPPPAIGENPLGKFADLLENKAPTAAPAAEAPPPPAATDDPPDATETKPAVPRPPPRNVNVAARLDDPLPAIEAAGIPLADFLQAMSDLSTIPITLDLDPLAFRKLSPQSPVTLKAADTTIGKAIDEALRPLQLRAVVSDDQLLVTLSEPEGGVLINYPVEDLTEKSQERAQQLAQWMTELVEPAAWKEEEGPSSLTPGVDVIAVQAPLGTHAGLFFLCEKLRVARGLPLKSKHDAALFRLQSRTAKLRGPLATPITINYSQPTLLMNILSRLGETAKVRILVDWQSLAMEGWNPDAEGSVVVEGQPLAETLDALLSPMNLAWRSVDEQTLQVTTQARLKEACELEIYPAGALAPDAAAGEALLARLRGALALPEDEASELALFFDPISRSLLASLPQPQQREVERLLAEWATESKAAAR